MGSAWSFRPGLLLSVMIPVLWLRGFAFKLRTAAG
jgi:hypothetical protein